MMREHILMQLEEAFGAVNRWYCSQHYGYEVKDRETLLRYYIKHGGAQDFANTKSPLRNNQTPPDQQQH